MPVSFSSGAVSQAETFIAGEVLGGDRLVTLNNGKVYLFDPDNENHADNIVGFTKTSALQDELVIVIRSGHITVPPLIQGAIYYGVSGGLISTTLPLTGVLIKVGTAQTDSILTINFSEPLIQI